MNILGTKLEPCSFNPLTGYTRSGSCDMVHTDVGTHTVCSIMTNEFLQFTLSKGNDLITPNQSFPGLKPGDRWCLCALRWYEAEKAGKAPLVVARSTHINTLRYVPKDKIEPYLI